MTRPSIVASVGEATRTSLRQPSRSTPWTLTPKGCVGVTRGKAEVRIRDASVTLVVEWQILRQAHAHEHAQEHELRRLQRFRNTVLTDPAAAMSYWFVQHPDQVDDAVYTQIVALVDKIADHASTTRSFKVSRSAISALLKLLAEQLSAYPTTTTGNRDGAPV
jgi:hypothetical protein